MARKYNECRKCADMSLANLERWCAENDGDMTGFFGDGSIYGEDGTGGLIVGYGIYGSANLCICKDHVDCGGYSSAKFSPELERAMDEFRSILENC